jgi:hypothetical protein
MKAGNGKTGRTISFHKGAALEAAMLLFLGTGLEGTSMADLTQAMGLSPSRIYAAFGKCFGCESPRARLRVPRSSNRYSRK